MSNNFLANFYQQLNPDNTMSFNRLLAHAVGVTETIIFYTLIGKYYYYSNNQMVEEDGWFYVTVPDLHESTSFNEKAQRKAIKHLADLGFIQATVKGLPPKRYFKINNNLDLLQEYLVKGKEICDDIKIKALEDNAKKAEAVREKKAKESLKSTANDVELQFLQIGGIDSAKTAELIPPNGQNLFLQNGRINSCETADKSKSNKSKSNKSILYQSYQSNLSNKEYMSNSDILESSNKKIDMIDEIDKNKSENMFENREHISTDSIKAQLNYDTLISEHSDKTKHIDSLVNLVADVMKTKLSHIRIARESYPRSDVVERFKLLTDKHVLYVIEGLQNTKPKPRNVKSYLLTALYNAPMTYESYIASKPQEKEYSFDINRYKELVNRFD
ncbi:MAG: hypothetical protein IJA12_06585 [Oscillospiraceae bacterium]|nr:hypothetical protein [Oscillospiraceae bacterium]